MPRKSLLLCLFLVMVALPVLAQRPVTLDDIMQYRSVTAVEIAPDGKRAAVVVSQPDFDENVLRANLYLVDSEGKATVKLTNGPRQDTQPRWSTDGHLLAFISDRPNKPEKAAKSQIWIISPDGGEAWQLTRERLNVKSFEWLPDGKRMVLVASAGDTDEDEKKKKDKDDALVVESDIKPAHLYLVSVPDGKTDLLYSGGKHISSISVSPQGDEVAFAEQPTPKVPDAFNSNVRVLTIATRAVRDLLSPEFSNSGPKFSPDGKWIAFEADSRTDWWGNSSIYIVPAAGGQSKNLTADFDERPLAFEWADDSSALYFSGPRKMDVGIYKASLDGKLETLDVRAGMYMSPSIAAGMLAVEFESPSQPNDVYFVSLRAPAAKKGKAAAWAFAPKKVTDLNPQLKDLALAKVETFTWRNRNDGMEVEGQLFLPANYAPGKAYPTLLMIHGGPAGVFNNAFVMRRGAYPVQTFTSAGYVVLAPNPRGSGGYGLAFRKANVKDWGYADYNDLQHGLDALIEKGIADRDRLGVMGWSYGGFMTSWTVTQTQRFKAASIGAPVTNLFSFYGTTDIPPFIESYFGNKPWENRELMAKHSAMYHVDKVTTPSLLQHGGDDRRVPYAQSEEFFTALRIRGIPSELIKYPRQPHGIQEPKLIKDAMMRNLEWFDRYVMGNQQAAKWHTSGGTAVAASPGPQ